MSLADEEDVQVVADITDEAEISAMVEQTAPEFLVVGLDSRDFGPLARQAVLQKYPEMKILAVATDGNSFTLFSASDGIRSIVYEGDEAEILKVMRDHAHIRG